MIAWTPFVNPITVRSDAVLWLVLPLIASVAIVYKTIRTRDLRRLPIQIVGAVVYMVVGLTGLCALLWLIGTYWP